MSLSREDRKSLILVAKQAIEYALPSGGRSKLEVNPREFSAALQQSRATFVTLNLRAELRGCIGTLEAHQPLVCDVAHNAHAAAFSDPRFFPVTAQEYPELDIHISILSPATPMVFSSENDLISQLQPGIDGLVLQEGIYKGTFLPSVWESLADARQFLAHLKRKAGLPIDYWSDSLQVYRYTTESFGEQDLA